MDKEFLVCIDSDGCAFDTMEIKHKECFCPSYINFFGLQAVSKYARDAWDFANLYSCDRGMNRFLVLLKALDLLRERRDVLERGFHTPDLPELRAYVADGKPLNNDGLEAYLQEHPDSQEIRNILAWSYDVNHRIGQMVHSVPPFPHVRKCLELLQTYADIVIVSATQTLAVEREWAEHDLLSLVTQVKGQEAGTKKQIIAALKGDYAPGHVLMIGDAPGDRDAAKENDVLFYPIYPDQEAKAWAAFPENMDAFLGGTYAGAKEQENIAYFETLLPQTPNWEVIHYGTAIGEKFYKDGSVRRFAGNTVVADILPGCAAYDVMTHLRSMIAEYGLSDYFILLPEDSYHMTILGGLNDQKRPVWWPEALPMDASMEAADDHVAAAMEKVGIPGPQKMKFDYAGCTKNCMTIQVRTLSDEQEHLLRKFRDDASAEMGVFRPNHEKHKFHISLAYVRVIPEGDAKTRCDKMLEDMTAYIAEQPIFETAQPYLTFFDDMLFFHHNRIPRD